MAEIAHSTHGASSAKRWINCPGSINAINALPEEDQNTSSIYAAEGQAAHNLGELCLREGHAKADEFIGTAVPDDENAFHECTDDMAEAVNVYLREIQWQKDQHPGAECAIEEKLDLTWLRPGMFGTADFRLAEAFGDLIVTDYKHGQGVVVECDENEQLMYYALGALANVGGPDEVENVTVVIVQPRAPHPGGPVRRWTINAQELWEWGRTLLGPAYDATLPEDAPRAAGEWCRFCPAQAGCSATRALVQREARLDFDDIDLLDPPTKDAEALPVPQAPEELSQALYALPLIEQWCKAVRANGMTRALRGEDVIGHKLVRGRSNRKWRDAGATEKTLKGKRGVASDDIYKKTLQTPAQIEKALKKLVGKDNADKWMAKHAIKPEGALSLVPDTDARDSVAVETAADDFPALPEGETKEST